MLDLSTLLCEYFSELNELTHEQLNYTLFTLATRQSTSNRAWDLASAMTKLSVERFSWASIAWTILAQSVSTMMGSWAHCAASRIPSKHAYASASAASRHLKRTRHAVKIIRRWLFLAMMPTPAVPDWETKEPSIFTLVHPAGGGSHVVLPNDVEPALLCLCLRGTEQGSFPFPVFEQLPDRTSDSVACMDRVCLDPRKAGRKDTSDTVVHCSTFRLFVVNIIIL